MKTSARRTLAKADALYLSTIDDCGAATVREQFNEWRASLTVELGIDGLPVITGEDIPWLVEHVRGSHDNLRATSASLASLR